MNIEEIVMFPTQLQHVETTSIKAEKKKSDVKNEFAIFASVKGEVLGKNTGKSIINIKVCNEEFSLEEEKIGIFKFEEDIVDDKKAIQFMEVQGIRILWSM